MTNAAPIGASPVYTEARGSARAMLYEGHAGATAGREGPVSVRSGGDRYATRRNADGSQ